MEVIYQTRVVFEDAKVMPDGCVIVHEHVEHWDGATPGEGELKFNRPRTGRLIDVGDDVSNECQEVQDIINGNLHSADRKAIRDAIKAEEEARRILPEPEAEARP